MDVDLDDSPNNSSASQLPDALLTKILSAVSQQQRFKSCAVVSRMFARCASAATTSIKCIPSGRYHHAPRATGLGYTRQYTHDDKLTPLNAWLAQHSRQVESMELRIHGGQKLVLPCAHLPLLTELDVTEGKLELQLPNAAQGSSSGAAAILPKLCELRLARCTFTSSVALLRLPPLTALTRVDLSGQINAEGPPVDANAAGIILMRVLPHLAHLVASSMWGVDRLLQVAPSSLTALDINAQQDTFGSCLPRTAPQLARLQQLSLSGAAIDPAALASMPLLKILKLEECLLWPEGDDDEAPAAAFLGAVRGLQQLEQLVVLVDQDHINPDPTLIDARRGDCSALTASPHLTRLDLQARNGQVLPRGAIKHMAPAGRQFPQLLELVVRCGNGSHDDDEDFYCDEEMKEEGSFMSAADLQRLVSACPSLRSLDITCALRPCQSAAGLLDLPTSCQALEVGGDAFDDKAAAIICQLTHLTSLSMSWSPLTLVGVDQLTALQDLQKLELYDIRALEEKRHWCEHGCEAYHDDDREPVHIALQTPLWRSDGKPVWQQIQDLVLRKAPVIASWQQRLQQQQQANSRLQQHTDRLQQNVTDLAAYTRHSHAVTARCAGGGRVLQLLQEMADIVCTALADTATAGGDGAAAQAADAAGAESDIDSPSSDYSDVDDAAFEGDGSGDEAATGAEDATGQYLELHAQVLAACGDSNMQQQLSAMQEIALRALAQ